MSISTALRRFLLFSAAMVPVALLAFLWASDFFGAWDGHAVSVRPATSDNPSSFMVLIANDDGTRLERAWPTSLVQPLGLPIDPLAIPPDRIPPERPRTRKSSLSLYFLLKQTGGDFETIPTTSPATLGIGFLVFLLGIAGRNMIVAGSPFSIALRGLTLPKGQSPSGQIAPSRGNRPRKGPPPPRSSKGRGRR